MTDYSYIRVRWRHESSGDPVDLWSELNSDRFETRKLEFFRDGKVGYASAAEECCGTRLGFVAVPSLSEIAADPQFDPEEVSKEAFEKLWNQWCRW